MWFMNFIANPFVRLILRSPFHRLMSAATLLITVRGRRTGRAYTLPVQYVQTGDFVYILPGAPERKTWWRNLRGGAPVQVLLRGQKWTAKADVLSGETAAGADCETIVKALELYFHRFPPAAKMHKVRPLPDGSFHPGDLQKAAAGTILVRVKLNSVIR